MSQSPHSSRIQNTPWILDAFTLAASTSAQPSTLKELPKRCPQVKLLALVGSYLGVWIASILWHLPPFLRAISELPEQVAQTFDCYLHTDVFYRLELRGHASNCISIFSFRDILSAFWTHTASFLACKANPSREGPPFLGYVKACRDTSLHQSSASSLLSSCTSKERFPTMPLFPWSTFSHPTCSTAT